jgi:hypothetical protein
MGAWAARISLSSLISASAVRGGARSGRMRRSLIVVQVALSLVLLSAGGLVVRSFQRLLAADPGFRTQGVLTLRLSTVVLNQNAAALSFHDRAVAALRALPGVTGVSATNTLPLSGGCCMNEITFPGAPGNAGGFVQVDQRPSMSFVRRRDPGDFNPPERRANSSFCIRPAWRTDVLASAHGGQNSPVGFGMISFRDGSRRGDRFQSSRDCPDSCLIRSVGEQVAR